MQRRFATVQDLLPAVGFSHPREYFINDAVWLILYKRNPSLFLFATVLVNVIQARYVLQRLFILVDRFATVSHLLLVLIIFLLLLVFVPYDLEELEDAIVVLLIDLFVHVGVEVPREAAFWAVLVGVHR